MLFNHLFFMHKIQQRVSTSTLFFHQVCYLVRVSVEITGWRDKPPPGVGLLQFLSPSTVKALVCCKTKIVKLVENLYFDTLYWTFKFFRVWPTVGIIFCYLLDRNCKEFAIYIVYIFVTFLLLVGYIVVRLWLFLWYILL